MTYNRILAVKLRSLGDTVLMTSGLEVLKKSFPRAEIHAAVTDSWTPVLESHPSVSKIWSYHRHRDPASRAKAVASLSLKLRKVKFDCVVNFHASPSSALLSFATGAKVRAIHFHGHTDKNKYSTVEIPGKGTLKPILERDLDAIRALGVDVARAPLPALYLDETEKQAALKVFASMGLKHPFLGVGIGASRPTKIWPMGRFAEVAKYWKKMTGGSVIAFGAGHEEKILLQELLDGVDGADWFACMTDLPVRELAAQISICQLFIGNDSGPRHVAVSVSVPTLTLIGPEHPLEWHPYPADRHPYFYIDGLACRKDAHPGLPQWCGLDVCLVEKHRCMTGITLETVQSEVMRLSAL